MNHEPVEQFIKGVVPPEYQSDEHRRQLRARILAQAEASRTGAGTRRGWKTAVLLLGLLGVGAAATEIAVQVHRYYFEGRAKDGTYHFSTESTTEDNGGAGRVKVVRSSVATVNLGGAGDEAAAIEQARKDLEEIDVLRQMEARELVGVTDTEVNGRSISRAYAFKYVLADGRTQLMGEGGFDRPHVSPAQSAQDQQEIADLRRRGQREVIKIMDTDLEGHTQRTLICLYVLKDGREETVGESDPGLPAPAKVLNTEQHRELMRLVSLKNGELVSSVKMPMFGKTFIFQQYLFTLPDGTVVTHSEGEPEGWKANLNDADWKALRELSKAGTGEMLGNYQEEIRGQVFNFTRVKYILSDGTQVVQSCGKPDGDQ